jgi:hypothetical protein
MALKLCCNNTGGVSTVFSTARSREHDVLFAFSSDYWEHEVQHGREIFTLLEARASKIAGDFREFCFSVSA